MNFKFRQMEVFRAVMLTGSISGAARMLYVSQPAVSKIIAYTESRLGLQLFNRISNRLVPTQEAETLFREVEQVYSAAGRVDALARELAASPLQGLRVCCSASLASTLLPPALAEIRRKRPSLEIEWYCRLIAEMPLEIIGKKADLAISAMPIVHEHLHSRAFMTGNMVCALPAGHPLSAKDHIDLEDLREQPLILYRRDLTFGKLLAEVFAAANFYPASITHIIQTDQALELVRQGMGIAIVDEFAATNCGLTIKPMREPIELEVSFVFSKFVSPAVNTREFMGALLRQAERMGRRKPGVSLDFCLR